MKKAFFLVVAVFFVFSVQSQEKFSIENRKNRITIPFQLINDLVFFPIQVNGVELNFMLDSGAKETLLFSLDERKEVDLNNVEKIKLRGLGSSDETEGLKSVENALKANGFVAENQTLYVVLDQKFNLSSQIGIPVNGIIGYNFFKGNSVEVNYEKQKLYVYRSGSRKLKKLKTKSTALPMTIEESKPYVLSEFKMNNSVSSSKLLVDIGNSDALWLFQNDTLKLPEKKIEDYIGMGFSGEIEGYRGKIDQFTIAGFDFYEPIVAFPDKKSFRYIDMVPSRIGSLGAGVLKRFNILLDYVDETIYFRKNRFFDDDFTYNLSGIVVKHAGMQWINDTVLLKTEEKDSKVGSKEKRNTDFTSDFKYQFQLKPIYKVAYIRKKSVAEKSGLQPDDVILSINELSVKEYDLQQMNTLLKGTKEKKISLEIERNGAVLKLMFLLEEEL